MSNFLDFLNLKGRIGSNGSCREKLAFKLCGYVLSALARNESLRTEFEMIIYVVNEQMKRSEKEAADKEKYSKWLKRRRKNRGEDQ